MRDDFCALILSHGRPDNVKTYGLLKRSNYTGPIFVVIDDEDKTADEYRKRFGNEVVQFKKSEMDGTFDLGDNYKRKRNSVIFARNRCHEIVRQLGYKYFIELDDDYNSIMTRYGKGMEYGSFNCRNADELFSAMVDFLETSGALSVCLSQGGDHIGGKKRYCGLMRKAMNTFVCSVDRPFQFVGRMNDDVNTYCTLTQRGNLFFTIMRTHICQQETQQKSGGLTEMYLDLGTYVKSFYTVMMVPSAVKVSVLEDSYARLHHSINWHNLAPKIISERHRKVNDGPK